MSRGRVFTFAVDFPGDPSAGLLSFFDVVRIEVESGDPGEVDGPDDFRSFMRSALAEWYDGARVSDAHPDGTPIFEGWHDPGETIDLATTYPDGSPLFEGDSLDDNPQGATPPTTDEDHDR